MDDIELYHRDKRIEKIRNLREVVGALKLNNEFPQTKQARRDYINRSCHDWYYFVGGAVICPTLAIPLATPFNSDILLGQNPFGPLATYSGLATAVSILSLGGHLLYKGITSANDRIRVKKLGKAIRESKETNGRIPEWAREQGIGLDTINFQ